VGVGRAGEWVKGMTNTIRYRRPQPERALDVAGMEFIIEKVTPSANKTKVINSLINQFWYRSLHRKEYNCNVFHYNILKSEMAYCS